MNKVLDIIDDLFLVLLMFASVTVYFGLRTEPEIKSLVKISTNDIISDAKKNGYITLNDYEKYMNKLSLTDTLYNIKLEHSYNVWEPEYRKRTLQEILDAQNAAYTGSNVYTYREVNTTLPVVNDPVSTGDLNSETNESVMANAVNTPASSSHVHTDDCYNGTKHIHTGNSSSGAGCYSSSGSSTPCLGILSYVGTSGTTTGVDHCLNINCQKTITVTYTLVTYKCSKGHSISAYSKGSAICPYCGAVYSKNFPNLEGGTCGITSSTFSLSCGKTEGHYYNGETEVFPTCNQVVTSISPTHPIQKVAYGEDIISTILATYLDGSSKTIIADISGYDCHKIGTQTVTLTYSGLVDNAKTTGKKTATIKVTVVPLTKTCPKGHTYNLNSDGTDPGCPYCKAYVSNLQIIYPTNPLMTITIGSTLKDNGLKLLVSYMDGHTEVITDGYIDNLDSKYFGTMIVTIGYKGVKTQIQVTTKCKTVICPICGNTYSLYPDGSNPGCPYCVEKIPVFTGKVLEYTETEYTEDILSTLYKDGIYKFIKDDTFAINISNKSSNIARKILQKLLPSLPKEWVCFRDSEVIRTDPR